MSKQLWLEAYNEKYDECAEKELRPDECDKLATDWADGSAERFQSRLEAMIESDEY